MERVCAYRTPSAADRHPLPGGHAAGERPRRAGSRGVVLVSACLAGVRCRYDGGACPDPAVVDLVRRGRALPVCPEQLGGLPTPRRPAEIRGGAGADVLEGRARVVTASGADVTDAFLRGAEETLRLARLSGAEGAILKARSPSTAASPGACGRETAWPRRSCAARGSPSGAASPLRCRTREHPNFP